MKKVLVFVAAAIFAVAAQAASISWGSGTIEIGGAKAAKGAVTGYLYLVSQVEYDALDFSDAKSVYDSYKAKTASATGTSNKSGVVSITTTANAGDTQYAVIIYEDTANSQFVLTKGYDSVNSLGDQNNVASGNLFSAAGATGWSSTTGGGGGGDTGTPEPTSGLLLLVGGAMLALRRKQK